MPNISRIQMKTVLSLFVIILNWSILVWVHVGVSSYDSEILIWFPTSYHTYQETPRNAMLDWGVHDPEKFCPFWYNLNRYFIYGSQLNQTMLESQYTLYRGFSDLTTCWSWFFSFFRSFQNWFLMSCTPSNHIITKQPIMTIETPTFYHVDLFFF